MQECVPKYLFQARIGMPCCKQFHKKKVRVARLLAGFTLALGAAGCSTWGAEEAISRETIWVVTADSKLIRINAARPQIVLDKKSLTGLPLGEHLVGIDYRVARGVLYAVSNAGRVYTLDTATGFLSSVSKGTVRMSGEDWGMDFNPVADRIRLVSNTGKNMRLHPDTGELVDFDAKIPGIQSDPDLSYSPNDIHASRVPQIVAAAYTYNKKNDKLTTNFAIDRSAGTLVTQGSREEDKSVVSPNSGVLFTVGSLGLGQIRNASFDIADVDNAALAAISTNDVPLTSLYRINLNTGQAQNLGRVADGAALLGMAIEP